MALSNTAVPKYYGQFRDDVIAGRIPICEEIELEMNRIDQLIDNPGVWYDEDAVEGFIAYCENEMTLTDGGDLKLLPTFKLWAEEIFGWYYYEDQSVPVPMPNGEIIYETRKILHRLINEQYLIIPRSAAKTLYASLIHSYFLNVDTSTTHQIATAFTLPQAEETLTPIKTAIARAKGPLFQFLTDGSLQNTTGSKMNRQKLASTKKGIENFLTNSILETKPMSVDKLQTYRAKIVSLDEWLSCDIRENVLSALRQTCAKVKDYLILAISSEGTVRNAIGDDIKIDLYKILRGELDMPWVSIFYYKLDDISEVRKPSMWIKANPNLGRTVSYETYQREVDKIEKSPIERNDTLAKRFNIPMEGQVYYFSYDEIQCHKKKDYYGMPCSLGADLSRGDDFCSFTFLFPLRSGEFGVKTRNYISQLTYDKLPQSIYNKYQEFIKEGSLIIMDGTVLDMMAVYEDLDTHISEMEYDVRAFGYDPYNAKDFIARWESENGPFGIEKVIQGARTESVPLGELKKLSEERMLLFDEEIMKFAMGNCIVIKDTNDNKKLYKRRNDQKIDCVAAMMDSYVSYKINREAFD